jgi:hypothetical protein
MSGGVRNSKGFEKKLKKSSKNLLTKPTTCAIISIQGKGNTKLLGVGECNRWVHTIEHFNQPSKAKKVSKKP